jgi:hypothetical protein
MSMSRRRTISFDEITSAYPKRPLYRAAVRDLSTGEVRYACDEDCAFLRIR